MTLKYRVKLVQILGDFDSHSEADRFVESQGICEDEDQHIEITKIVEEDD